MSRRKPEGHVQRSRVPRRSTGAASRSSRHELLHGFHAVTRALERRADAVLELWISGRRADERMQALVSLAVAAGVTPQVADDSTLERLSEGERHQGIVARVRARTPGTLPDLLERLKLAPADVLVLDGVCDPHNLGACLRVAAGANIAALVMPRANASPLTPTVHKVACGGAEVVDVFSVPNIARTLQELARSGLQVIGLAGEGDRPLFEVSLRVPTAFVMGTESSGLRRLTREQCDMLAAIPMPGPMESLNLSVSTGIVLFEAIRQRNNHQTH